MLVITQSVNPSDNFKRVSYSFTPFIIRRLAHLVWFRPFLESRGLGSVGAVSVEEAGSVALSPREQRALRRKEKSRLAAKMRRNQESNILFCLLRALPVSLPDTAGSEGSVKTTPSGLNLEKSGVIRMAGQTLFLYNSLSQGELTVANSYAKTSVLIQNLLPHNLLHVVNVHFAEQEVDSGLSSVNKPLAIWFSNASDFINICLA